MFRAKCDLYLLFSDISPYRIWSSPLAPKCLASEIGHVITLLCNTDGSKRTVYKWTKGGRVLTNDSWEGILNVSISSSEDFGVYTCHAMTSYGVTNYNITVCQSTADVEATSEGMDLY